MPSYDSSKVAEIHRHLHSDLPSDPALRVKALESLVVEKGLVSRNFGISGTVYLSPHESVVTMDQLSILSPN